VIDASIATDVKSNLLSQHNFRWKLNYYYPLVLDHAEFD